VEVFDTNNVNLATDSSVGAVASQSSDYFATANNAFCVASFAIDGSFSNTAGDVCRGVSATNNDNPDDLVNPW
jgi:hypothetical protein